MFFAIRPNCVLPFFSGCGLFNSPCGLDFCGSLRFSWLAPVRPDGLCVDVSRTFFSFRPASHVSSSLAIHSFANGFPLGEFHIFLASLLRKATYCLVRRFRSATRFLRRLLLAKKLLVRNLKVCLANKGRILSAESVAHTLGP